jgi:acyl dehydratase
MTEEGPAAANLGSAAPAPRNGATMAQPAVEGKYYEDFGVGEEIVSARRTVSEGTIDLFAGVTGDFSEVHTDAELMKESEFGERIGHGILSLGVVVEECRLINQRKETVLTGEHVALVRRRPESIPV